MNRFIILCLLLGQWATVNAQKPTLSPTGSWQQTAPDGSKRLLMISDTYLIETVFTPTHFISTRGGTWKRTGGYLSLIVEFDSQDSSRVGFTELSRLDLQPTELGVSTNAGARTFRRVDQPAQGAVLCGLWRITSRANEAGQQTPMAAGPRKTLKLLTGTRFQWVAINPETRQFSGTGGGTYTLTRGQYTETIDFFSRDDSRVGRSLTFGAEAGPTEWHHTGTSSTGGRVDEVWRREP
ncbi:hypothetical protein GCM10027578_18390 [Spirosoma luteolum]